MSKRIDGIQIAGHTYNVIVEPDPTNPDRVVVVQTECVGRWAMTTNPDRVVVVQTECLGRWVMTISPTGDDWLDARLEDEANKRLHD